MLTTHLGSKGQIIIPKEIRREKCWTAGMEFVVKLAGTDILLHPLERFPKTTVDDIVGCTHYNGPAKTIEDMDAAIAKAAGKEK